MRQILVNFSCFVLALLLSSQIYGQSPPDSSDGSLRDTRLDEVDAKKQLQAVASRTLTWLTGSSEQNAYVSVGRLANFFGFIKFRVASGHSLTRSSAGQETYALLTESQRKRLVELHAEQMETLQSVVLARQQVNHSLESILVGEQLDKEQFLTIAEDYSEHEAELGRVLAIGLGEIATTLSKSQIEEMREMRLRYLSGKSGKFKLPRDEKSLLRGMDKTSNQEFWNLTSRLLTWVTGTPEDNDFETVGKPSQHFGFVSLRMESGHSVQRGVVANEVQEILTEEQITLLKDCVSKEIKFFEEFLQKRGQLLREFEQSLEGKQIDKERVHQLARVVGRIEGIMTLGQATAILSVRDLMTNKQAEELLALRKKYVPVDSQIEPTIDTDFGSASALYLRGQHIFAQCALCHISQGGGIAAGPNLDNIVGKSIATDRRYPFYSPAMKELSQQEQSWSIQLLDKFLKKPRDIVPSTTMGFDGLRSDSDRQALIAYLQARSDQDSIQQTLQTPKAIPTSMVGLNSGKPKSQTLEIKQKANIILLLSDDQAWSGLSTQMHPEYSKSEHDYVETPRIEQLAQEGTRFSSAYAPSSVCSPTRVSLQTGKSPAQLHWTKAAKSMTADDGYRMIPPVSERNILGSEITIAELLHDAGYATAHFGKWHIGGGGPGQHGYDVHDGDIGNEYAETFKDPNPVDIFGMTERAVKFITSNVEAKKPFFLQMSYHALHRPENANQETVEKYESMGIRSTRQIQRAALAENLDTGVGMLLDSLESLGIDSETYIIYMSDNGAGGSARVLRGGKGSLWEGGVRVPFIIRGPGIKSDVWDDTRIVGTDLYPTFAEIAGVEEKVPKQVEGGSLVSVIHGINDTVLRSRDGLYFHFPHYQGKDGPQSSIVLNDLKLIKYYDSSEIGLYDLVNDIDESSNLATRRPEDAKRLLGMLDTYLLDIGAELPLENPKFDPSKLPDEGKSKRGKKGGGGGGGKGNN